MQRSSTSELSLRSFVGVVLAVFVVLVGAFFVFRTALEKGKERNKARASVQYYVDKDCIGGCTTSVTPGTCNDLNSGIDITAPWCTIQKAANTVLAGAIVNVFDGHYNEGVQLTRDGTELLPITYRAMGQGVYISPATNLLDENFIQVVGYPDVYSISLSTAPRSVRQTHFENTIVDDPGNESYYILSQNDGPINLTNDQILDLATLQGTATQPGVDGGWFWSSGILYVNPYGSGAPSTSGTDLWSTRNTLAIQVNANYNIVDGFKFWYADSGSGVIQISSGKHDNQLINIYSANGGIFVLGNTNTITDSVFTHGHMRKKGNGSEGGYWLWTQGNDGTGIKLYSYGNIFKNSSAHANWNNISIDSTLTGLVMDNVNVHASPNHCLLTEGSGISYRNIRMYNCQDDFGYIDGSSNVTFENSTTFGGITLQESAGRTMSNLTFQNMIFGSCQIAYTYANSCAYESGVSIKNSLFFCAPGQTDITIEHCTNPSSAGTVYTLDQYRSACAAGTITGCMQLNNLTTVTSDFANILVGGRWVGNLASSDTWDVHIVSSSSSATNGGISSGASTDIDGQARPIGGLFDIGADEFSGDGTTPTENQPPVLETIGDQTVQLGSQLTINITATDADTFDHLTFSVLNRPTGSSLQDHGDRTATFTWIPTVSGAFSDITFGVTDGTMSDVETITITVIGNSPPVLTGVTPSRTITVGDDFSNTFGATDSDVGDVLRFTIENMPEGATFVDHGDRTATFRWKPSQTGKYRNIRFIVTDGTATDTETITLLVRRR